MTFHPHPDDRNWWIRFHRRLRKLDNAPRPGEQLALIQRDDVAQRRSADVHIACRERGQHDSLTACWACFSDVHSSRVRARAVLRARSSR